MKSSAGNQACEVHGITSRAPNKTLVIMVLAALLLICWHVWTYGPTVTPSETAFAHRSFPVVLGNELWDLLFNSRGIIAELRNVFPYFMIGILLAGFIRTYKIAARMRAALRRRGLSSIFLASIVGIITPLCACGTVTTAVSLLFAGLPLAPVMALLVTSPLLSPSAYLLTLNDLGPEWTVIRTAAAFFMGIFAGVVTHLLRNRGFQTREMFIEGAIPRGDFHDEDYPDKRLRCSCKENFGNRIAAKTGNLFVVFLAKSSEMLWLVGKYVLVGISIGAVVERYMPNEWIFRFFGQNDPLSIVWITLGSVPVFVHQISASSMLYHVKSSLDGTLNGGAALAFMIGGPVTAVPTMILFWTVFKRRVFFLYLFICVIGTILISYAFQSLLFVPYVDTGNRLFKEVRSVSGGKSSIIEKLDKKVRLALDPDGKGVIATYRKDLGGEGAVVFDSSLARFESRYDNGVYLRNVAAWLEEENTSQAKDSILVILVEGSPAKDSLSALAYLSRQGFRVKVADRRQLPDLSVAQLGEYGQLWFLFGSGRGNLLSESEIETAVKLFADGKSMLIASNNPGEDGVTAANQLSSRFGVRFFGRVENRPELRISRGSYFLNKASAALGAMLRIVHKA